MDNQLNKIIGLIQKTGDKCVVFNPTNEAYVVMTLKDYEKLVLGKSEVHNLTEDELLDKINRDIAVWRSLRELENKEVEWDEVLSEQFGRNKPEAWDENHWEEAGEESKAEPWEKEAWEGGGLESEKQPWEKTEDHYYFEPVE